MRIAVVGKGGAGKSVIAGTAARILARRGHRVLAVDTDLMPGLAFSLGMGAGGGASLEGAAEKDDEGRWRLKKGVGPVRAVQRHAVRAPDGVRLLQCAKLDADGIDPIRGPLRACYAIVRRLGQAPAFRDWAMVGDLPAGPRQAAYDWAAYADTFVVVAEPTWKSALTARRVARIARGRPGKSAVLVASKVEGEDDVRRVAELVGEPAVAAVPIDAAVAEADRLGVALIDYDPSSPAALAIEGLVDGLAARKMPGVSAA
ncbi:MAG: hypothetical protein M3N16_01485 [Actinomycetota bacterium]|nr:hypothetical protein [Actinomycetota bacterium]